MFTQLKTRTRRALAALTATALLAGTAAVGIAGPAAADETDPVAVDRTITVTGAGFVDLPAGSSSAENAGLYAAIVEKDTDLTTVTANANIVGAPAYVTPNSIDADGKFTTSLTVPAANASDELEVVVWAAHGYINETTLLGQKELALDATTLAFIYKTPREVTVTGAGFVDMPNGSIGIPSTGVYAVLVEHGTDLSTVTQTEGMLGTPVFVRKAAIDENGNFSTTLAVPVANRNDELDVVLWSAHGFITETTLLGQKQLPADATSLAFTYKTPREVTVTGAGFVDLPLASTGKDSSGVYAALVKPGTTLDQMNDKTGIVGEPAFVYGKMFINAAGEFSTTVKVPVANRNDDLEVVVWSAHGDATEATLLGRKDLVADATSLAFTYKTPREVTVSGTGFTDLPLASTGKDSSGVYAALVKPGTTYDQINDKTGIVGEPAFVYGKMFISAAGEFSTTVKVPVANRNDDLEVVVWTAHGDINDDTILDRKALTSGTTIAVSYTKPAPVVKETIKSTKAPVVTGTAAFGSTLTTSAGSWNVAGVTAKYQWLRNGVAISGATKSTYKLTAADVAKKVSVKVTASKDNYNDGTATSATKTVTKAAAPKATKAATVSGTATFNKTLTAKVGTWNTSGLTYKYQWLRNGVAIKGATKSTYKLTSADVAKKVSVKVTASKANYNDGTSTSAATAKVAKVTPSVTAKLAKTSIKSSQKTTITVTVKASGVSKPTGKVTVKVGKKTFTKTLKSSNKGKVTVTVKNLKKGKKQKVTVSYAPSSSSKVVLKSKTISAKPLTVR